MRTPSPAITPPLPVHGFVLAGGQSSRMGTDKALQTIGGRALVEIAVSKLQRFCSAVSIAGNRDDLQNFAPVVHEQRNAFGPVAGVEAGLTHCRHPWAVFVPVDVPLVPAELLRRWTAAVLDQERAGCGASFLLVNGRREPTFCAIRREYAAIATGLIDQGERRVADLLDGLDRKASFGWLSTVDASRFAPQTTTELEMATWFLNVNTPSQMVEAHVWFDRQRSRQANDILNAG